MTRRQWLLLAVLLLGVIGVGVVIGLWLPFPHSLLLSFAIGFVVAGPLVVAVIRGGQP